VSSKNSSIYFLTSGESKIRAFCDICGKEADGIACILDLEMKLTTVIIKCHKRTLGVKITDELLNHGKIAGFVLDRDEKIKPVERQSRIEPIVSIHTMRLEAAVREAKEKIYKKIHGNGSWIDSSHFGIVRSAMTGVPADEVSEAELPQKGRRIILED